MLPLPLGPGGPPGAPRSPVRFGRRSWACGPSGRGPPGPRRPPGCTGPSPAAGSQRPGGRGPELQKGKAHEIGEVPLGAELVALEEDQGKGRRQVQQDAQDHMEAGRHGQGAQQEIARKEPQAVVQAVLLLHAELEEHRNPGDGQGVLRSEAPHHHPREHQEKEVDRQRRLPLLPHPDAQLSSRRHAAASCSAAPHGVRAISVYLLYFSRFRGNPPEKICALPPWGAGAAHI